MALSTFKITAAEVRVKHQSINLNFIFADLNK